MTRTRSSAIAGVAAITMLAGGCFLPPPEPAPELTVTLEEAHGACVIGIGEPDACRAEFIVDVTNTGDAPTLDGVDVTVTPTIGPSFTYLPNASTCDNVVSLEPDATCTAVFAAEGPDFPETITGQITASSGGATGSTAYSKFIERREF